MSILELRKLLTIIEETLTEGGREVSGDFRKAATLAVITNPFAGEFVEDLTALFDVGSELGALLGARAVAALG